MPLVIPDLFSMDWCSLCAFMVNTFLYSPHLLRHWTLLPFGVLGLPIKHGTTDLGSQRCNWFKKKCQAHPRPSCDSSAPRHFAGTTACSVCNCTILGHNPGWKLCPSTKQQQKTQAHRWVHSLRSAVHQAMAPAHSRDSCTMWGNKLHAISSELSVV